MKSLAHCLSTPALPAQISWRAALLLAATLSVFVAPVMATETAEPIAQPVRMFTVGPAGEMQRRSLPGEVVATTRTELAFRVPGELTKLPATAGQPVAKGTLLAKLDPIDYQLELEKRHAIYELAQVEFTRRKDLVKKGLISQAEHDRFESQLEQAKAVYEQAKANLSYTELHAPFDGQIARVMTQNHEYVTAKESVLIFSSESQIDLVVQIPERLMGQISQQLSTGQQALSQHEHGENKAWVSFPAATEATFEAQITELRTQIDPQTQSYRMRLSMQRPAELALFSGMNANVTLSAASFGGKSNALYAVPADAVITYQGQPAVWKFDLATQQVSRQTINVDRRNGRYLLVSGDISQGDVIAVSGIEALQEDQQVREWVRERGL